MILSHCYRETNNAADWLANHRVNQEEDLIIHNTPPHALTHIIHQDPLAIAWIEK